MWRHRAAAELRRYLVLAVALSGLAASARFALAPPRPSVIARTPASEVPDRPAEGFALLFARRYLEWRGTDPERSAEALSQFTASVLEPAAGLVPPATGGQIVEWAGVADAREPQVGFHVYTVAAQTDSDGLVYLTVDVRRGAGGALSLWGYPAFVGPPATESPHISALRELRTPALETVVIRALRNYLAGSATDLAADLAPGAHVSLPTVVLTLLTAQRLGWAPVGSSVEALITARDRRGAQYTLEYELDVTQAQGRWEVKAIQTDPNR
jgi:hypothetical protein